MQPLGRFSGRLAAALLLASLACAERDPAPDSENGPEAKSGAPSGTHTWTPDWEPGAPAAAPSAIPETDWFAAGRAAAARARSLTPNAGRAKNVVLFVGDGMGVPTVTAARILKGQQEGAPGEEASLSFERLPHVALAKTYNTNQQVPDSAGTMTAMMSGVKTKAGIIGLSDAAMRGDPAAVGPAAVATLLEQAEARGLSTGVVSTARITHATPAACYAHASERDWEADADLPEGAGALGVRDIAQQLLELSHGDGLEVALGGGRTNFLPVAQQDPEHPDTSGRRTDGRDLTREWVERAPRSAYVWNAAQLRALDLEGTDHLLGLFEPSHLRYEVDRESDTAGEPSLEEMTRAALAILSRNENGFFLMVEAGRIDHAHHAANARRALVDTIALDRAVSAAMETTSPEDTLIIVTADHGHTITIGGYPTRGNPILGIVRPNAPDGSPAGVPMNDASGKAFTTLLYANGPGHLGASKQQPEGPKHYPHYPRRMEAGSSGRPDLGEVDTEAPDYLQEGAVPLRSETHGGEDVPIYAGGAGAALFHGVQEQSFVYHAMVEALGWAD